MGVYRCWVHHAKTQLNQTERGVNYCESFSIPGGEAGSALWEWE